MANDLESTEDIRKHTEKLLRKAGALGVYPTPVEWIIEAAGLTESEENLFEENIIQSLPSRLQAAFLKLKTKVLAALDRREKIIYINRAEGTDGAIAFRRLHEVTHKILPWQQDLIYADNNLTLSPSVQTLFEREANQGAAELIFQRDHFTDVALDYKVSISSVIELHVKFGSSIHAAFRRYIESHKGSLFGIVLKPQSSINQNGFFERNEILQSKEWIAKFGDTSNQKKFLATDSSEITKAALLAQLNPRKIVDALSAQRNGSGQVRNLRIEAFYSGYVILVLMWDPKSHKGIRAKRTIQIAK